MKLKEISTEQKLKGAYYTPNALAGAIVDLFCDGSYKEILEPSCGDGIFLDKLSENGLLAKAKRVVAVELDDAPASTVKNRYSGHQNVTVLNEDFFDFYKRNDFSQYDLIIGNPPYIRYQYLENDQRSLLSSILTSHNMKANKLVNAWVGFMVACTDMLRDGGTLAFVIPAEILQVVYAEDLRLYLATHFSSITLLAFEELVFPEIEQEVLVFVGKKGADAGQIRVIESKDTEALSKRDISAIPFQPIMRVHEKWTKYFIGAKDARALSAIKQDPRFVNFSDVALINVGITTGNNKFFSLDDETSSKYDLDEYTLPLIGRSSHASGIRFEEHDWEENRAAGKRSRLLVLEPNQYDTLTPIQQSYIDAGEESGENTGYKCSIRESWYSVPSVWVPDAFFLRRNNLYPKFVLNACSAVSTDTMHRIKFNDGFNHEIALLAYYNSVGFAFTELCGRSYGGGVLEILPKEVGSMMLPDLFSLEFEEGAIEEHLRFIDDAIRSNSNIEIVLDRIDSAILVNELGLAPEMCQSCRRIWKTLQKRRLLRAE